MAKDKVDHATRALLESVEKLGNDFHQATGRTCDIEVAYHPVMGFNLEKPLIQMVSVKIHFEQVVA